MSWRLLHKLLACCLLLLWCAAGQAAAPAAGVVISNTAQATFLDTNSGTPMRLASNTVHTRVAPLEALTLTSSQGVLLATGAPFAISHTLTNTGNTDATFLLSATSVASSGFTPLNLQVVRDNNGNGRVDPGEAAVGAGGITLPAGSAVQLIVTGEVPATAAAGVTSQILVTATSQLQGAQASNTDTLTLTSGAAVQVMLSAGTSAATQNGDIDWTAATVNNGSLAAGAQPVTVDGVAANLFVLRVPVPANTTLLSATAPGNVGARTLYHALGSPAGTYVSTLPAGAVDAIAWSLPELPAGGSFQGQFRVRVSVNASGAIRATAYADWLEQGTARVTASNEVQLPLPSRSALITFYTGNTYVTPAVQNAPGRPLFLQADVALCNMDPSRVDTVPVTLVSQLTGDIETFTGVETGPNTGLFRIQPEVPTANGASRVVAVGDGILEVLGNDVVTASIVGCAGGAATATTTLLIDPTGVVYDSRTNQPLAGATVQLIDVTGGGNGGLPGGPATVLDFDTVTPAPSTVVTGADGVYSFPLVQPSTYRLRVTPPAGFQFPSALPPALQPATRIIDAAGSFGGNFVVGMGAVHFDVPLDTGGMSGLFVQKAASKASAEVGDFVDYTVTVKNVIAANLNAVQLRDTLPTGFLYVKGTARLNGNAVAEPAGGTGPNLTFAVGTLSAGTQAVVTYRVRIGAGSQSGNGINTAQASASGLTSNRASVRVQVLGGVFAGEAYVIGKVYADCKRDGVQDGSEPGVPGVRIYLEDGTYAVTDEEGKYSFYGLTPRTHVAKVDTTTLPVGTRLQVIANRNAMDAGSRFVDLTKGELHKADFAVTPCDDGVREQIAARRKALRNPAEIAQAAATLLTATPGASTDARTLPASGALGLPGAAAPTLGAVGDTGGSAGARLQGLPQPIFRPADAVPATPAGKQAEAAPAVSPALVQPLEELLPQLTPDVGFVGLAEGQALPTAQTRVRVKGPLGATFELRVNGQVVPVTQVGKRTSLEQSRTSAWEYIGVDLKPGRNTLDVQVVDPFGNVRGKAELTVLAPGALAAVKIDVAAKPVADASTPIAVNIALRDAGGLAVTARTQVTLQASAGQWQVDDADPHQAGTQVFIEGGAGRFLLLPPAQPGKAEITVVAGTVKQATAIEFVPALRPLIAAGLVEGALNLRKLSPSAVQSAQSNDVFEREIRSASRSVDGGKGDAGAHAALFLKGKVLGSSLLTLAYDSDKASDARLFRDIQPNQFYPVYGDSSARGFDGQSSGRLYVLLQNGSNYALLGDFATQGDNPARQLTQYTRSLNGAKGRWSDGTFTVEGFASRTSATQVVQEFRANGTSGPFQLNANGVVNSEQVHVLTRSRNQPALVLKDVPLVAFTDYAIEPYTGLLILKSPVPSLDADLNPVFIRVAYDVDAGGPKHDVAGVEANVRVAPGTTVGAVVVADNDPLNRQRVEGLTLTSRIAEKTVLTAEVARSHTDLLGDGKGERVEFKHEAPGVQARVWGVRTDSGFANAGSPQTAGQEEYGAKIAYSIDSTNRIVGEALKTANATTGAQRLGVDLKLEHTLPGNAKLEVGVRHSTSNTQAALTTVAAPGTSGPTTSTLAPAGAASGQEGYTSARVKLTTPIPGVPQADVYGLAEQAIDGSSGREVGIGANYAVNAGTKLYLRHDFINSLTGPYALNSETSRYTTVAGVNTTLPDQTQVFNEYRMADAVDGRTAEAAVGLRRTVDLASGVKVNGSLQRIKPLQGASKDDSTAVAVGAEYTKAADWKASAQAQWQTSATSQGWLLSGALVNKLDADWTLLNRFLYSDQESKGGGDKLVLTAQSGLAFRPVASNKWNALARIEYKRNRDTTAALATDEAAWMLSGHVNYQPTRAWTMSGRYAARWVQDDSNGLSTGSFTQLLGGRSTWDLSERWDAGVQAYGMWGNGSTEAAFGVQVGYLAWKNLWLSAGYNFKGFHARELSGDAQTAKGAYVRLRFKFDEALFEGTGDGAAKAEAKK